MIEYECDQVLLLNKGKDDGEVQLNLAKHRNGPQGVMSLLFQGSSASFSERAWSQPEGY
jgi:replicative DNA helicase